MKKIITSFFVLSILSTTISYAQSFRAPVNGNVNISSASATARTQMTVLTTSSCLIQANPSNAGAVYVGGYQVTNASGTNVGVKLIAGASLGDISVSNLNQIYVAADNANDDVSYLCN